MRAKFAVALWAGGLMAVAGGWPASGQEAAKAPTLARYFPAKDLVAYAEFDGLGAHAEAWKKTSAYRLLNETTTGAMLDAMLSQVADRIAGEGPPSRTRVSGKEFTAVVKHGLDSGFAVGIHRRAGEPKPFSIGIVLRGAAAGEVRAPIARMIDAMNPPGSKSSAANKPGDRKVIVVGDGRRTGFAWWSEGSDLVLNFAAQTGPDAMIEALDGRQPNATENAIRRKLAEREGGFEPVLLAYFDMAALPELPPKAASLGLDKVKRVDYRWGFQDEAIVTITRLVAPGPRSGVLAMLEQPTFGARDLPPMPAGLTGFTAMSLDPDALFEKARGLAIASDPRAKDSFDGFAAAFQQITGRKLREDVLRHLGPKMLVYTVPTQGNLPTNPFYGFAQGVVHVPKTSALIEVRDAEAFAPTFDALVTLANQALRAQMVAGGQGPAENVGFLPIKGPGKAYTISLPTSAFPLPAGMRPTIVLGKKYLAIGTTPDVARKALAVNEMASERKRNAMDAAMRRLPDDLTFLSVSDPRDSILPDVIANLPGLVSLFGSSGGPASTPFLMGRILRGPVSIRSGGRPNSGFLLRIDPDLIPDPDDLRAFLAPATYAFSVDAEGFRFATRESFPGLNPASAVPFLIAGLVPMRQMRFEDRIRAQSVNNLKQIALAMHNHESAFGAFPADVRDKDGKPLLSWRVKILPFVEQTQVFNEFHMDEPWDSPHNKALVEKMPSVYAVPGAEAEPGMTFYRGFSGKSTIFDPANKDGTRIANITDGTSNTLAVVEAREAVPWTKPDSDLVLDFDAKPQDGGKALLEMLGGHAPGGFNAMFMDGSVRFIRETISPLVLRALVTKDQGEIVSADSF